MAKKDAPTTTVMSNGEKNDILLAYQKNKPVSWIAETFGRDEATIYRLVAEFRPTTALARAAIMARSAELVDRILEKADVDQLIDLMQRPNIGVLAPVPKGGSSGGTNVGIMVSVNPGSLPAVDAAVYTNGQRTLQSGDDTIDATSIAVDGKSIGQFAGGD